MNDLKISEAAKQLVASFVDDNAWNGLSEHWKETASRTAQRIINSELDRIAGPLVEALRIADIALDENESESAERLAARGIIANILDNYRKERGE